MGAMNLHGRTWALAMLKLLPSFLLLLGAVSTEGATLPWETWKDLRSWAELPTGNQVLLRSSHCQGGCRYDRHSAEGPQGEGPRFVYLDGEEMVIFDEPGAGAITRIWMTMGAGVSVPLDPEIEIRIYVDGGGTPVVDASLPSLFDGSTPPFVPPLVGDRSSSSGGNYSFVPIPYLQGCRVALVGALDKTIWYQLHFHRQANADGIVTFTGDEDLDTLVELLSNPGADPWPASSGEVTDGTLVLAPGAEVALFSRAEAGTLTALRLALGAASPELLDLVLTFDGRRTVDMALSDFFGWDRAGGSSIRSLALGLDEHDWLYSYLPMPFFEAAEVALRNRGVTQAMVDFEARVDTVPPGPTSGYFGAHVSATDATALGSDFPVLSLFGHGKLVGAAVELGATQGTSRHYLEGDERYFIDGSWHPAVYGTGVEDYFAGGFYFDQGPFSLALHGSPYTERLIDGLPTTAAYRFMMNDGATFENQLLAGLESGPTNNLSMRARVVSYYYHRPEPRLRLWDRLDLGDAESRNDHAYEVEGILSMQELDALFEGEPPRALTDMGAYRPPGSAHFVLHAHPSSTRFRIRRRLDAATAGQPAHVLVNGQLAGSFPLVDPNQARRWREVDLDLPATVVADASNELQVEVVAEDWPQAPAGDEPIFSAFEYQLWADDPEAIFADSFESGDLDSWARRSP